MYELCNIYKLYYFYFSTFSNVKASCKKPTPNLVSTRTFPNNRCVSPFEVYDNAQSDGMYEYIHSQEEIPASPLPELFENIIHESFPGMDKDTSNKSTCTSTTSNLINTSKSCSLPTTVRYQKPVHEDTHSSCSSSQQSSILSPRTDILNSTNTNNSADSKPGRIRGKRADTYPIENMFCDLTNKISTYLDKPCEKENIGIKTASPEQVFGQFIGLQLEKMSEPEKSIRQQKLFHVLTAPLDKLL